MSTKNLIDTLFSLGKLHQSHKNIEDLDKYGDNKFFQHLFRKSISELLHREMSPIEMAYLTKGLITLRRFFDPETKELEL